MTGGPDREAIIDAVAREKPWRTPPYLVLFFLRRWAVVLFTLSFMLGTRQHWAVAAIAVAGALWFDLKITPNALDLRLTDREFVRKIYDCEAFEADTPKQYSQIYFWFNVLFVVFVMFSIFGQIFVDYKTKFNIDYKFLNYLLYCIVSLYICFNTRYYPITKIPQKKHIRMKK